MMLALELGADVAVALSPQAHEGFLQQVELGSELDWVVVHATC